VVSATKPKTAASTIPAVPKGLEPAFASRRGSASLIGVESDWLKDTSFVLVGAEASADVVEVTSGMVDDKRVVGVPLLVIELVTIMVLDAAAMDDGGGGGGRGGGPVCGSWWSPSS